MTEPLTKLYYSISEVTEITGIAPHILRYWEKEFRLVAPRRSAAKVRQYRQHYIRILLEISELLYVKKFTIEGAKLELKRRRQAPEPEKPVEEKSEVEPTKPHAEPFDDMFGSMPDNGREVTSLQQQISELKTENQKLKTMVKELRSALQEIFSTR